jgi:hypothetical protein
VSSRSIKILVSWRKWAQASLRRIFRATPRSSREPLSSFDHKSCSSGSHSTSNHDFSVASPTVSSSRVEHKIGCYPNSLAKAQIERSLTNSSCSTRKSYDDPCSRPSLGKFIEQHNMIHLGDISARDGSVSDGSTCLVVSFAESYPQLVLQTSSIVVDDSSKEPLHRTNKPNDLSHYVFSHEELSAECLGASFSHPARNLKIKSSSRKKQRQQQAALSCNSHSMSFFDDTARLWEKIDRRSSDRTGALLFSYTMNEQPYPTQVETELTAWDSDDENSRSVFPNGSILNTLCQPLLRGEKVVQSKRAIDCPFDELE